MAPQTPAPLQAAPPLAIETVETLLTRVELPKEGKMAQLTTEEVHRLASMVYADGSAVLTLTRRSIIYEVIGGCALLGVAVFVEMLEALITEAKVQPSDLVFEVATFDKEKNQYLADMERSRKAISVMKGVLPCIKCNSMNTATVQIQQRSADEPMSVITTCFACGKRSKKS